MIAGQEGFVESIAERPHLGAEAPLATSAIQFTWFRRMHADTLQGATEMHLSLSHAFLTGSSAGCVGTVDRGVELVLRFQHLYKD